MTALSLALAVFGLASVTMLAAFIVRVSVTPLTLISGLSWAVLALQGRNLVVHFENGSSTTVGEPATQFLFGLLGLLNLVAFIGSLPGVDVFPPGEEPEPTGDFGTGRE